MGRKMDPKEAKARWEARAAAFAQVHAKGFRGAMSAIWNLDRTELDRRVYGVAKPTKRSGNLRGYEVMRLLSASSAIITNTASSIWKGTRSFYAHFVAKGVRARNKGRKYYAWMIDPRDPRPRTWEEWVRARDEGRAVLAHRLRAVPGRPWRQAAIKAARARGIRASYWRQSNKELHSK
jgi:hypothetical protein